MDWQALARHANIQKPCQLFILIYSLYHRILYNMMKLVDTPTKPMTTVQGIAIQTSILVKAIANLHILAKPYLPEEFTKDGNCDVTSGVCGNLEALVVGDWWSIYTVEEYEPMHYIMSKLIKDWKYYTGNYKFPVPMSKVSANVVPMDDTFNRGNLWIGEQGELRREYCLHLLAKLDALGDIT